MRSAFKKEISCPDSKDGPPKGSRRVFSCLGSELKAVTEPSLTVPSQHMGVKDFWGFTGQTERYLGQIIDISHVSLKLGLNHKSNVANPKAQPESFRIPAPFRLEKTFVIIKPNGDPSLPNSLDEEFLPQKGKEQLLLPPKAAL